jgi:hypothetical protein
MPDHAVHPDVDARHLEEARRLLGVAGGHESSEALVTAVEAAARRLEARLAPLISQRGFRALFARALHVSKRRFTFLNTVQVEDDAADIVAGLSAALRGVPIKDAVDGVVAMLGHFTSLLVTFIGEDLALRFIRDARTDSPAVADTGAGARGPRKERR